eukprot:XP_022267614.1 uncharacterized protein LOC111093009 [Canis lupus familiaris]
MRICISPQFPGDLEAAGAGTTGRELPSLRSVTEWPRAEEQGLGRRPHRMPPAPPKRVQLLNSAEVKIVQLALRTNLNLPWVRACWLVTQRLCSGAVLCLSWGRGTSPSLKSPLGGPRKEVSKRLGSYLLGRGGRIDRQTGEPGEALASAVPRALVCPPVASALPATSQPTYAPSPSTPWQKVATAERPGSEELMGPIPTWGSQAPLEEGRG